MKTSLFVFFSILSLGTFGQYDLDGNFDLNFDNDYGLNHLSIDTVSNPNNSWQICIPDKGVFEDAFSSPEVIMTDSINSYSINDTSIFYITNTTFQGGFEGAHTVILAGQYFVDSDSLTDYGKIEFSPDNGLTWIDMLNDSIPGDEWYYDWYWDSYDKPILTGNSGGWKKFWINLASLGKTFDIKNGDTVLYKFSFISDNIDSEKAGLMFDNLHFEDWCESSIKQQRRDTFSSTCFPNPVSDDLTVKIDYESNSGFLLILFDTNGKIILKRTMQSNIEYVGTKQLNAGVYHYQIIDANTKKTSSGRFIVN